MANEQKRTISVQLTEDDIAELITTAFEAGTSGIGHWVFVFDSAWKAHDAAVPPTGAGDDYGNRIRLYLQAGGRFPLHELDTIELGGDEEPEPAPVWHLTWEGVTSAASKMAMVDPSLDPGVIQSFCNLLLNDIDGPTADAWFQMAVFGEIKYG